MNFSTELITLAADLAREFDNESQAIADPAWYVHLRWWHRPIPLFAQDSLSLFAEQANVLNLDRPYRPRILRLQPGRDRQAIARIQDYGFRDPEARRGAARDRLRLERIAPEHLQDLPGCALTVARSPGTDRFRAVPPPEARCCFTYSRWVPLNFSVTTKASIPTAAKLCGGRFSVRTALPSNGMFRTNFPNQKLADNTTDVAPTDAKDGEPTASWLARRFRVLLLPSRRFQTPNPSSLPQTPTWLRGERCKFGSCL